MKLIVSGRHLTVSAAAHEQIRRHVGRLERLLGDAAVSAQCVIGREGGAYACELTLHARGDHMLHGKGRDATIARAVAAACARVGQQAQKLKGRWQTRRRQTGTGRRAPRTAEAVAAPAPAPRVVRTRPGTLKPMTLDDAILALEGSRDGVVAFRQADGGALAVVYRRTDGRVGLVEPES